MAAMVSVAVFANEISEKAARKYATGGEVTSFRYHDKAGIGYTAFLHKFTNTAEIAKFKNRFGKALPVRVLAVGGGGAGMDGFFYDYSNLLPGGGGGGGGGVSEFKKSLSAGEEWSIRVGAGGGIANHNYGAQRGVAGSTSISNALNEVVFVPGGGAGGGGRYKKETYSQPTAGAAGGGGSCDDSNQTDIINGAPGTYSSHTLNNAGGPDVPVGAPFKGGDGLAWSSKSYGGGGGGAGASGENQTGGIGLASDISGETVVYGSGGGGGGNLRLIATKTDAYGDGGEGGTNAGCGGRVRWEVVNADVGMVTNVYISAATVPVANTGCGGGGGVSFTLNQTTENVYIDDVLSPEWKDSQNCHATPGADGVVMIRYDIPDTPCVGGDVLVAITNGLKVTYIHKFTNTMDVSTFKPSFTFKDASINVRVLAVGGGGAGMDGFLYHYSNLLPGGGGGGGGGVREMKTSMSTGEEWSIRVGAGGEIANHNYGAQRGVAGSTSISNDSSEVVFAPGGGAGGGGRSSDNRPYSLPTVGAAGGGGSSDNSALKEAINGALGMFCSSTFNDEGVTETPEGSPFKGGDGKAEGGNAFGGGGGGAGASGENQTGGIGLASDISGEPVVYGSGGGGGGNLRLIAQKTNAYGEGGDGGTNAGCGGRVSWEVINAGTVTNVYLTAATMPVANTGSGGGGGVSFTLAQTDENVYIGDVLSPEWKSGQTCYATPGADGVVIIRYEAVLDHPLGTVIVVR